MLEKIPKITPTTIRTKWIPQTAETFKKQQKQDTTSDISYADTNNTDRGTNHQNKQENFEKGVMNLSRVRSTLK